MRYIRIDEEILETQTTNECIYVIRNKNIDGNNCYVSYLWDNWKNYHLIDFQNCILFSYSSAQNFISDLMKENLNYQDLVIEISPYWNNCKQADTIEELCDGFYIDEGNEFSFYKENAYEDFEEVKKIFMTDFDFTSTLYGFIKTRRGLIYVAKMNNEGKLELI